MIIPYHVHTHYSIQEAFAHIPDLVQEAKALGLPALAITDLHTLSGCVSFHKECKKKDIRPILGCDVRLTEGGFITLLARNREGWKSLIKITGNSDYHDGIASIDFYKLLTYINDDLIVIIGGYNSFVHQELSHTQDLLDDLTAKCEYTFYSEEQGSPLGNDIPASLFKGQLHTNPVWYVKEEDRIYQEIMTCSKLKITIHELGSNPIRDIAYLRNTASNESSLQLLDLIQDYEVNEDPFLPEYLDIEGLPIEDTDTLLRQLCREGWVTRGLNENTKENEKLKRAYVDRIQEELKVFEEAKLSKYILVVKDIIDYVKDNNCTPNLRGSAAGCLVSYLIGVSDIDPIIPDPTLPYHPARSLKFERFYNVGRNSDNHISLPDVDIDIPISFREKLINHMKEKYGEEKVGHIITFARLDGRGAIKEVFRVLEPCNNAFDVANEITRHMIDTAKVQDVLEELIEDNPDYTIIDYCVDHIPEVYEYAQEYKKEFQMAVKLSKTITNQGKHAAGIVISNQALRDSIPMMFDPKTGGQLVGLEMADAEYCGAVKYDFLGVAALEKIDMILDMINFNLDMPKVGNITKETNAHY